MDPSLSAEALSVVASARAWVEELVEEGVDHFDRVAAPEAPAAVPTPTPTGTLAATAVEPSSPEPGDSAAQGLEAVRRDLGDC